MNVKRYIEELIVKCGQIVTSEQIYAQAKDVWGQQVAENVVTRLYVSFESALAYHGMFDQLTNKTISISQG